MKINNLIIVFFVISYYFSISAEIDIMLSENFLKNQETLQDFQLTLLYINSDENKFLHNISQAFEKNLIREEKKILKEILSRKNIIAPNETLHSLKKLSIQSLDEKKIIKEGIATIIMIKEISDTPKNKNLFQNLFQKKDDINKIFNIKIMIFDKKSTQKSPSFSFYLDNNYSENSFKKIFLR